MNESRRAIFLYIAGICFGYLFGGFLGILIGILLVLFYFKVVQ
jgi:hypothetical protein